MHLDDGKLRAFLDGEISEPERLSYSAHLGGCPGCRAILAEIEARATRVGGLVTGLAPHAAADARATRSALAKFKARRETAWPKERSNVFQSMFSQRRRSVWVGLGTLAALVVAFSFAPVRTWAGEFLGLFRVQQIALLPVDVTRFQELTDDSTLGEQINQLFADSVTVTREAGKPQAVASAEEASHLAGFDVRLLGGRSDSGDADTPQLVVQSGEAFDFMIDRAAAQGIVDEAGRSDLRLPEALDGATISVDIPTAVSAAYGDCPDLAREVSAEQAATEAVNDHGRMDPTDCVILAQVPSPTVETPPDVDLRELAEIGLQFTGMTPEEAQAFSDNIDWTSTLVIPIPQNGTEYEQVQVDGVTGNLITRQSGSGVWDRYTILWVKDGIVYALAAYGNADEGLALANSLQ
jgi:hypothetical protein